MKDDKRLKRKVRNFYIVSTVSMALVLFLLGSVGYLMVAATKVARTLQESISVSVELRNGLSDEQKESLKTRIAADELVGELVYSSKEEKLADSDFHKMFESEFEEVLGENPLFDSFELKLTTQSENQEVVDDFIKKVENMKGIDRVSYPAMMAERLHATVGKIRLILFLFGSALLIISLILLSNTIRLAIFSKRYLINTMKLVGATKWFIMKPFLVSSIGQGVIAGLGAAVLFGLTVWGLNETIPEMTTIAGLGKVLSIIGAMIGSGIAISLLFTWLAVNKFVNMKSNKIYLY
ncbi:MAG: permease-like cell division protein FtsX [Alistipes sp.]